jgi:hypothetical protein
MTEAEVRNRVDEVLQSCLEEVPFLSIRSIERESEDEGEAERPDVVARLEGPDGPVNFLIAAKGNGQPRFARSAAQQLRRSIEDREDSYGLFIAPYISERTARLLKEEDVGFVDLAGNCRICFDKVYLRREGRDNPFAEKRELKSLFARKASRVLRPLLKIPGRFWTTTELSEEVGVSLGHVSNVRRVLLNEEWAKEGKKGIRLTDPEPLLKEWARSYENQKHERHLFYSFDPPADVEERVGEYGAGQDLRYALTAFSGAERFAPHVRYQKASIYVESQQISEVAEACSLKRVGSGETVELIDPYDEGVFYDQTRVEGLQVASPIQLYLDLRTRPGRGEEAAETLLKEKLRPSWKKQVQEKVQDRSE